MAAKLTDKQKKKIIADYATLESYRAAAKANGVSDMTVRRIVKEADRGFLEDVARKKKENTADVLTYMEEQKGRVCTIIGLGLAALCDPTKFETATLPQITTAIGTLIDKWTSLGATGGQLEIKIVPPEGVDGGDLMK